MAQTYDLSDLGGQPAQQTHDLSDLGGVPAQQSMQQGTPNFGNLNALPPLAFNLAQSASRGNVQSLANLALGPVDLVRNIKARILGQPTPDPIRPDLISGAAYPGIAEASKFGTDVASSLVGGGALARALPEAMMAGIPGVASRAAGWGTYGAIQNPEQAGAASGIGALTSLGADALFKGLPALKGAIDADKGAQNLIETLGQGRSIENNQQALAGKIKDVHDQLNQQTADTFNSLKNSVDPLMQPMIDKFKGANLGSSDGIADKFYPTFMNSLDKFKDILSDKTNKILGTFKDNPIMSNAHDLQSQLGYDIRSLQGKKVIDTADSNKIDSLIDARKSLNNDIDSQVGNTLGPENLGKYQEAREWHYNNVVPFKSDKTLKDIVEGKEDNPTNIQSIFSSPNETIRKVVGNLGPEAHDMIMYDLLGGGKGDVTAKKVLDNFNQAKNEGMERYVTPELQDAINKLQFKKSTQKIAGVTGDLAGSLAAGAGLGTLVGHPLLGAGLLAGTTLARNITPRIGQRFEQVEQALPSSMGTSPLAESVRAVGPILSRALRLGIMNSANKLVGQ